MTEQNTRKFLGDLGMGFVTFDVLFFEFLTPSTFGACNFLNSNSFLTIFSLSDVSIGGVQVLF